MRTSTFRISAIAVFAAFLWVASLTAGATNSPAGQPGAESKSGLAAPPPSVKENTGPAHQDGSWLLVLWSSSFEDAGWKQSRLWFARTRDWQTFTPAKVLFHPPYSVIDGTLLEHRGTYYLFHKEEEFGVKTGERRAIRLATSDRLEGPYRIHEGPLNQGQIVPGFGPVDETQGTRRQKEQ